MGRLQIWQTSTQRRVGLSRVTCQTRGRATNNLSDRSSQPPRYPLPIVALKINQSSTKTTRGSVELLQRHTVGPAFLCNCHAATSCGAKHKTSRIATQGQHGNNQGHHGHWHPGDADFLPVPLYPWPPGALGPLSCRRGRVSFLWRVCTDPGYPGAGKVSWLGRVPGETSTGVQLYLARKE